MNPKFKRVRSTSALLGGGMVQKPVEELPAAKQLEPSAEIATVKTQPALLRVELWGVCGAALPAPL
jgi:hypothetical protein